MCFFVVVDEDHVDEEPGLIFGNLNGKTLCKMLKSGFSSFNAMMSAFLK